MEEQRLYIVSENAGSPARDYQVCPVAVFETLAEAESLVMDCDVKSMTNLCVYCTISGDYLHMVYG